jgi:hypothetical protein
MTSSADQLANSDSSGDELTEAVGGNIIERHQLRPMSPSDSARYEDISVAAYYRAERRGFEPGHELEDWLAAERELAEREGATSIG